MIFMYLIDYIHIHPNASESVSAKKKIVSNQFCCPGPDDISRNDTGLGTCINKNPYVYETKVYQKLY